MTINYNGKDITLKYSFRGYIIYENIVGESFKSNGMKEVIILFYSMLVAADPESVNDFDTFIAWLDENPSSLQDFSTWLVDNLSRNAEVHDNNVEKEDKGEVKEEGSKN